MISVQLARAVESNQANSTPRLHAWLKDTFAGLAVLRVSPVPILCPANNAVLSDHSGYIAPLVEVSLACVPRLVIAVLVEFVGSFQLEVPEEV